MGNKECNCNCDNTYMPTEIVGVLKKSIQKDFRKEKEEDISNFINSERNLNCSNISDLVLRNSPDNLTNNKSSPKEKSRNEANEEFDINNAKTGFVRSEENSPAKEENKNEANEELDVNKAKTGFVRSEENKNEANEELDNNNAKSDHAHSEENPFAKEENKNEELDVNNAKSDHVHSEENPFAKEENKNEANEEMDNNNNAKSDHVHSEENAPANNVENIPPAAAAASPENYKKKINPNDIFIRSSKKKNKIKEIKEQKMPFNNNLKNYIDNYNKTINIDINNEI